MDSEFPQNAGLIYLNHAGVGPWPRRTGNAVCDFACENVSNGPINYEAWIHTETVLREQLRQMINAPSIEDIALMKNTSEALSTVAFGIPAPRRGYLRLKYFTYPGGHRIHIILVACSAAEGAATMKEPERHVCQYWSTQKASCPFRDVS